MNKRRKRLNTGNGINAAMLIVLAFITVYPFIYLLSTSISDPAQLAEGGVFILPKGFSLATYVKVLRDAKLMSGFRNSVILVSMDVTIGVFMTMMMAYPLAIRGDFSRYTNIIMKMILVTMYFGGGLIPSYLLIRNLGLIDTYWALCLPGAISSFHLIIARTFIREIPAELHDACAIDGANEMQAYFHIILPLCMPIVSVIILYRAVGTWNAFFGPLLYLNTPGKLPLQIYLREVLNQTEMVEYREIITANRETFASLSIKACILVISTLPILIAYPFLQKHFVKGMMIGAVKG